MNGLHPFTVYSFKVSAVNSVGESGESEVEKLKKYKSASEKKYSKSDVRKLLNIFLNPDSSGEKVMIVLNFQPSYYMITLREPPSGKPTITSAHNTSRFSKKLKRKFPKNYLFFSAQASTWHGSHLMHPPFMESS